jgi:hypothetical protein
MATARLLRKALERAVDLLSPLYKPLFVVYVLSTIVGLAVGSFTNLDIKFVGRLVVYITCGVIFAACIVLAIYAVARERLHRRATENPDLRLLSQTMRMKFCADGTVEFSEIKKVKSTKNNITLSKEWNGWRGGKDKCLILKAFGGSIKNEPKFDHLGMDFEFSFDSALHKGSEHEFGYTLKYINDEGLIRRYIQRANNYAPEIDLKLEIEEETSQPLLVRRMVRNDVYTGNRMLLEPGLATYRRYEWHISDPQHGVIYEIDWEHA